MSYTSERLTRAAHERDRHEIRDLVRWDRHEAEYVLRYDSRLTPSEREFVIQEARQAGIELHP